ncbi:hypothetical protein SALWKB2_0397 [Snodgrassella alvi wkB2]|nr:hypothetical protein SALWKB2_0397 [Snodgrassella alvi wkB2]
MALRLQHNSFRKHIFSKTSSGNEPHHISQLQKAIINH